MKNVTLNMSNWLGRAPRSLCRACREAPVHNKILKQAVRRNIKRFPADIMFELTIEEYKSLRSQSVTLKRGQHSKNPPFAFTEQGIAMLSGILTSDRANAVNIEIMRAFIQLRSMAYSEFNIQSPLF